MINRVVKVTKVTTITVDIEAKTSNKKTIMLAWDADGNSEEIKWTTYVRMVDGLVGTAATKLLKSTDL